MKRILCTLLAGELLAAAMSSAAFAQNFSAEAPISGERSPAETRQIQPDAASEADGEAAVALPLMGEVTAPAASAAGTVKNGWVKHSYGGWEYYDNGQPYKDGYFLIDGELYWFKGGYTQSGWLEESGDKYYFSPENYAMLRSTWLDYQGNRYYFQSNGTMKTGYLWDGSKYYHFQKNGAMTRNMWLWDGRVWVYAGSDGAFLADTWWFDDGKWHHFNANADRDAIWEQRGGKWYMLDDAGNVITNIWAKNQNGWCYLDASGAAIAGQWHEEGSSRYYLQADGTMATGEVEISGVLQSFAANGVWLGAVD